MTTDPTHPTEELSIQTLKQVDALCDQFETDWQEGKTPKIQAYMDQCSIDAQPHLFKSLLPLQLELCDVNILEQMKQSLCEDFPDAAHHIRQWVTTTQARHSLVEPDPSFCSSPVITS